MARFKESLDNLREMAGHIPAAMAASSQPGGKSERQSTADLERQLIDLFQREDSTAARIALLVKRLGEKYDGRAA